MCSRPTPAGTSNGCGRSTQLPGWGSRSTTSRDRASVRVALVSDVHGNAVGLDAVAGEIAREQFDEVVCLGDVAQGGPQPVEVVDRLRDLGWRCVFGNSDQFLLTLDPGSEEL